MAAFAGFVVLSVAVRLGWTDRLDRRLAQFGRPDDVWGPRQQTVNRLVDALNPSDVAVLLGLVLVLVALRARSLRPVIVPVAAMLAGGAMVALVKWLVHRPDPDGGISGLGSYPSGHALTLTLAFGLALLAVWSRPRWWHLALPVVPGAAMSVGLVIIGMHRASDAAGSLLLAETVLAVVAAWNAREVSSRC